MGRKQSLTADERTTIVKRASEGASPAAIAKDLGRDVRTVKKAIENINFTRKVRCDTGKCKVGTRDMRKIAQVTEKMPCTVVKPFLKLLASVAAVVQHAVLC